MRKRFPRPKGLGSRSYADRYAESRRNTSHKDPSPKKPSKNFLPIKKQLDLTGKSLKTSRAGWGLVWGIFLIALVLGIIIAVIDQLFLR